MGEPARIFELEPLGRQRVVTIHDIVHPVDDSGEVIDADASVMYGDEIDPEVEAELELMSGFSSDDAEPSDTNLFDLIEQGCPAQPSQFFCEPAGPVGRCRHCGRL